MPSRLRLYDIRNSSAAQSVGLCQGNIAQIAADVNQVQERLLFCREASDEGWWGSWAEMAFLVDSNNPFITTPRDVARIEVMTVCNRPVQIRNSFYEYLTFGNGRMPKTPPWCDCSDYLQTYSRNVVPTFFDLSNPPQMLRVSLTDPADVDKRVLLQGWDNNDVPIHSQDVLQEVQGVFVVLGQTPTIATNPDGSTALFNKITGIQKDLTNGQIKIEQVHPNTGAVVLLLTMEPTEQVSGYRRYFLNPTPKNCCTVQSPSTALTVSALVKLELIPVMADTDYLLIQSLQAVIEEWQSLRYSTMDTSQSKQLEQIKHRQAVSYLNGQLVHYLGRDKPSYTFRPYGSARLDRERIGSLR
jgi:hypothetical protein